MCHVIRFLFLPDGFDLSLTSPCVVRVQVHRFLLPTEQYVHSLCENPKAVDYRLSPVSQSGLVMANVTGMDEKKVCYLAEMSAGKQFFFSVCFCFLPPSTVLLSSGWRAEPLLFFLFSLKTTFCKSSRI